MKAALYCRVSSDRQAKEGDSIPAQLDALRKYSNDHHFQVVGEFVDDGVSGTRKDRDELQRLLDMIDQIDIIIFTKLDRWFRSIRHYINTQAILDAHGVDWVAIWEPVYDTTTPAGRLIVNQMMSIAQFEAENTGQRIRQVQKYKVSQKEVISGNVTPGYKIENKHMVIDPEKVDAVRLAFETYAETGNIAETIRATYGMGLPVTGNGMKNMLKREIYTGRAYGMEDFAPPIIDKDLFVRVNSQLGMHRRSSAKHGHIFSGLLKCAECGAVMSSCSRQKGKRNRAMMYRCPKHFQRAVKECDNTKVIYENVLERYLVDQFPALVLSQIEVIEAKPTRNAQKERELIRHRIDRLKELYVNDLIGLEEYKTDKERLLVELEAIPESTDETALDALKSLVGLNIEEIYTSMTRPEKKLFWRSVIEEIRFDKNRRFFVTFKQC